jgi:hypothetical protein
MYIFREGTFTLENNFDGTLSGELSRGQPFEQTFSKGTIRQIQPKSDARLENHPKLVILFDVS